MDDEGITIENIEHFPFGMWHPITKKPPENEILLLANKVKGYAIMISSNHLIRQQDDSEFKVIGIGITECLVDVEKFPEWRVL